MFLYKITSLHQLQPPRYTQRVAFSQSCMGNMSSDSGFIRRITFSDKCVFQVSGSANTQTTRIWGAENLGEFQQHKLQSEKLTLWWALYANGVIGRHYLSNDTIRRLDYNQMLDTNLRLEAQQISRNDDTHQDGVLPHIKCAVRSLLGWIVSTSMYWKIWYIRLARNITGLDPLNFFHCWFMKDQINLTSVSNILQLERRTAQQSGLSVRKFLIAVG